MRAKNITKVFTIPCSNVSVIMSPLATCPISCASTARASECSKRRSKPVLTATSALLRFHPVANALDASDGKIPTSGIPIPASLASDCTVSSNHCSSRDLADVMICTPVLLLAIHLDSSSEIKEPLKPNRAQKIRRLLRFKSTPLLAKIPSKPSRLKMRLTNTRTAMFVAKNSRILIRCAPCSAMTDCLS